MDNAAKRPRSWKSPCLLILSAAFGLGVTACERPEEPPTPENNPTTAAPDTESPPPAEGQQTADPTPEQQPASGTPWILPENWTTVPGERPMRLATFEIPDESGPIEVALTQFPGRVGGELANVNRWRGQMGLPPASEADLEDLLDRFEAPGYDAYIARVTGADEHMLAIGVYEDAADRTWYVRATAPADAIDRVGPEVIAFARSIAGLQAEDGG